MLYDLTVTPLDPLNLEIELEEFECLIANIASDILERIPEVSNVYADDFSILIESSLELAELMEKTRPTLSAFWDRAEPYACRLECSYDSSSAG